MYVIIDTFTQYAQKVTENRHSKTVTPNALIWGDWQAVGRGKRDFQLVSLLFFLMLCLFLLPCLIFLIGTLIMKKNT